MLGQGQRTELSVDFSLLRRSVCKSAFNCIAFVRKSQIALLASCLRELDRVIPSFVDWFGLNFRLHATLNARNLLRRVTNIRFFWLLELQDFDKLRLFDLIWKGSLQCGAQIEVAVVFCSAEFGMVVRLRRRPLS